MDSFDPARTALLVVHMAKVVAGQVDTPFNRLFRGQRPAASKPQQARGHQAPLTEYARRDLNLQPLASEASALSN